MGINKSKIITLDKLNYILFYVVLNLVQDNTMVAPGGYVKVRSYTNLLLKCITSESSYTWLFSPSRRDVTVIANNRHLVISPININNGKYYCHGKYLNGTHFLALVTVEFYSKKIQ